MPPQEPRLTRRLAAILAADVAGYARLTGIDETGTLRMLALHRGIMDRLISEYGGGSPTPPKTVCWQSFQASSMPCNVPSLSRLN